MPVITTAGSPVDGMAISPALSGGEVSSFSSCAEGSAAAEVGCVWPLVV
jgi:hypothetical protein